MAPALLMVVVGGVAQNPQFPTTWEVLENIYGFFKQYCGRQPHGDNETKKWRYTAYRQLSRFLHGVVGQGNRRVHPACAVSAIRVAFPKPEGQQYTRFIEQLE